MHIYFNDNSFFKNYRFLKNDRIKTVANRFIKKIKKLTTLIVPIYYL